MRFGLNEDQAMIQEAVRRFSEAEVGPRARAVDEAEQFSREALEPAAELGLLAMSIPEAHGGSALDPISAAAAVEELARQDASLAATVAHHDGAGFALARVGSPAQQAAWLPRLAAREVLGVLVTEAPALRVEEGQDGLRVSGELRFVPLGAVAGVLLLSAGAQLVAVDLAAHGVTRTVARGALGLRGLGWAHLRFEAAPAVGGPPAHAWDLAAVEAMRQLLLGAVSVGIAGAALTAARAYALERRQFRRPIADCQAIPWKLADTATQAADLAALQARLLATGVAVRAAYEAVQIFGGNGFVREYTVERLLRDAKVLDSGAGQPAEAVAAGLLVA